MCTVCVVSKEAMEIITTVQAIRCDNIFSAICSGGETDENCSRFRAATIEYVLISKGLVLSRIVGFSGEVPDEYSEHE